MKNERRGMFLWTGTNPRPLRFVFWFTTRSLTISCFLLFYRLPPKESGKLDRRPSPTSKLFKHHLQHNTKKKRVKPLTSLPLHLSINCTIHNAINIQCRIRTGLGCRQCRKVDGSQTQAKDQRGHQLPQEGGTHDIRNQVRPKERKEGTLIRCIQLRRILMTFQEDVKNRGLKIRSHVGKLTE